MAKSKKVKEEEIFEDEEEILEDEEEVEQEPLDEEDDFEESTGNYDESKEEYLENTLHLSGKIYAQSDIYKQFPHLTHDVKLGFFDKFDKLNFRFSSSAYQTYGYVQKISKIGRLELKNELLKRKELYKCETLQDLEEYFKKHKKTSLFVNVKQQDDFTTEEVEKLLIGQLKKVNDLGLLDEIYGTKEEFYEVYDKYLLEVKDSNKHIDDIGLMNRMATYTETSKAYKGEERKALNTTINISREVKADEDSEETPETPENSSGSGIKKFFRGKK